MPSQRCIDKGLGGGSDTMAIQGNGFQSKTPSFNNRAGGESKTAICVSLITPIDQATTASNFPRSYEQIQIRVYSLAYYQ